MMVLENILSQEIVQRLGWMLLHFIWQATTVALILAVLLAAMRKSRSHIRYTITSVALGLIILLPVVTFQLMPVSVPKPIMPPPTPAPVVAPIERVIELPASEAQAAEPPVMVEYVDTGPAPAIPWRHRLSEKLEPALPHVVLGWIAGVLALSVWHLGGWTQLQRLRRKMIKPVDASLYARLDELAEKLGVRQAVALTESALVRIPTVVGWLRPAILLPASALTGLTTEQLDSILAHELAHIRRQDYLVNMLQTIIETLGFYHPAVWWVSHKIRTEREHCCDDLAIIATGDRVRYARALTSMEEIRGRNSELAVTATGGNLFSRISRLVGKDSDEKTFSWIPAVTVILLLVGLIISTTLALNTNEKSPDPESITNKSKDEPPNAENNDSTIKVLIEAQTLHVNNDLLEQAGLDADSLKNSNSWMQYRVDNSRNPSMFVIDSQTKERLQKNIDESKGSSSISHIYMMGVSGREATIKNISGYAIKSLELGRFIKVKPTISQDGQSTYLDCELLTRWLLPIDVSKEEIIEYKVNAENALLSDDDTLLILDKPISNLEEQKRKIILIETSIVPSERSDDINVKASSYNVANSVVKMGSKTSELLRIYLDLHLEPGQYVEIKDNSQRKVKFSQVDTGDIGRSGTDFPAYADYIDFEIRSNFDLNLSTKRHTRGSFFKHDNWAAYFTGPDIIIGNGQFSKITLCVSMWRVQLLVRPDYDIIPSLVAVIIKPTNNPQEPSAEDRNSNRSQQNEEFNVADILDLSALNEIPWGDVVEGTQIRLVNASQIWGRSDWPHPVVRLQLDARNEGGRFLHLPENGLSWQIEVDGVWYEWIDPQRHIAPKDRDQTALSRGGRLLDFNPGDSYADLTVDIAGNWRKIPNGKQEEYGRRRWTGWAGIDDEYGPELKLQHGPHRMRVAITCLPSRAGYYKYPRLISNTKEIEIPSVDSRIDVQTESTKEVKSQDKTGVVSTATIKPPPRIMVTRVYHIADLIGEPDDHSGMNRVMQVHNLVKFIQKWVEPESWYDLDTQSQGTITPYPIREPKKLAIYNTPRPHEEIQHLLGKIRSGVERIPTEYPRQMTINGRCITPDRQPIPDTRVVLYSLGDAVSQVAESRTNSRGQFRLGPVDSLTEEDTGRRRYLIFIPADDHGPAWRIIHRYEQSIEFLELKTYEPAKAFGRIVTADSTPVAGARVWVREIIPPEATEDPNSHTNDFFTPGAFENWSAKTDSGGAFRISGVPDNARIQLAVSHPEFARSIHYIKPDINVSISVHPRAVITGRVLYGKGGKSAAGVNVCAQCVEYLKFPGGEMMGWAKTVTDDQGRYEFGTLGANKYNIWAEAENLTMVALDSFKTEAGKMNKAPDLRLIKGGFIAGRVIDEKTGEPVKPGAASNVAIYGPSRPKSGAACESSRIREDGSFRIRVAPGRNYIYLRPMGDWFRGKAVVNPPSRWINVAEGQTVETEFKIRKYSQEELDRKKKRRRIFRYEIPKTVDEIEEEAQSKDSPEKLDELDIHKTQVLIETRILSVTDEFLEEIDLDANSVRSSVLWSEHLIEDLTAEPNSHSYKLILDDLSTGLLLKAATTPKDFGKNSKTLATPMVLTLDGKQTLIQIVDGEHHFLTLSDPNNPSWKSHSKSESFEVDTNIRLTSHVMADNKNVRLDFELEFSQVTGYDQHIGSDGKKQKSPLIAVDGIKTTAVIPDGKTLLIGGKKIHKESSGISKRPFLGDLPLVGGLFRGEYKIKDTKNVLILIKPTINPPKTALPEPPPLDPDDPLLIKLQEKFETAAAQK